MVCTPPSSGRSCSRTRRSGPGIRTARTQGSLCPWNMVPSMGVNVLPQPWQCHLRALLPSVPHPPLHMKGRRSLRVDAEEGDLLLGKERRVPVLVHAPVAQHDCRIGIAPLLSACGSSPSWPGGRRRLGLPHRKSAATCPAILAGRYVVSPIIGRQTAHSAKDDFYGKTGAEENSPTPAYRKPLCHLSTICEDRTRSHSHSC